MNYAFLLLLLGLAQTVLGIYLGGYGWLLLWPALSFAVVGAAYGGIGPKVFGKRPDGTLGGWNVVLLLPFLLFAWIVWYFQTRGTKEPSCHEIVPGVWLGRRVSRRDLPPGTHLLVDLTAEFPESRPPSSPYLCLPTLDHETPDPRHFREVVSTVAACPEPVYVHCALGHGRSAMVVAAVLVLRGQAATVEEAMTYIKTIRPGVKLSGSQWAALQQWQSSL